MAADAGAAVAGDCGDLAVVDGNGSFAAKAADTGAALAGDGIHLAAVDSDIGRAGDHADAGHTAGGRFNMAVAGDLDGGRAGTVADADACGAGGRGDMAVIDGNVGAAAVAADARIAAGNGAHGALVGDADIGVGAAADTGHTAQRLEDHAVDDLDDRALVRACITSANAGAAAAAGSLIDGGVLDGHSAVITAADAGIICSLGNDGRTALNGHLAVAACTHADAAAALAGHSAVFDFYGSSAAVCSADACTAITAGGIYGTALNGHIGIAVAAAANTGTIITTGGGNIAAVFDGNGSIAAADTGTGTFSVFNSHIVQCNIGGFATHAGTNTSTAAIASDLFNRGVLDVDLRGLFIIQAASGADAGTAFGTAGHSDDRRVRNCNVSVSARTAADARTAIAIAIAIIIAVSIFNRAAGNGDVGIAALTTADTCTARTADGFFDRAAGNVDDGIAAVAAADACANAALCGNRAAVDGNVSTTVDSTADSSTAVGICVHGAAVDGHSTIAACYCAVSILNHLAAADGRAVIAVCTGSHGDIAAIDDNVAAVFAKFAADGCAPATRCVQSAAVFVIIIDVQCAVFGEFRITYIELISAIEADGGAACSATHQSVAAVQLNVGRTGTAHTHGRTGIGDRIIVVTAVITISMLIVAPTTAGINVHIVQCDVGNLIFVLCFNFNSAGGLFAVAGNGDLIVVLGLGAIMRGALLICVVILGAVLIDAGHLRDVVLVVSDIHIHIAILQIIGARKGRDRAGCDHRQERCRGEDTENCPVGLAVLCLHKKYPLFFQIPKVFVSQSGPAVWQPQVAEQASLMQIIARPPEIKRGTDRLSGFLSCCGKIRHSAQEIATEFGGI